MSDYDDIARRNRKFWDIEAGKKRLYTKPWLDLDREMVQAFAEGAIDSLPEPYAYIYPQCILENVAGKDILCLASGGGQQSAIFGLLGAKLTVLDLSEEQLKTDSQTAEHYGYKITVVQDDMRDLSFFADESFDLVYQAISLCFVPEVREVYREVARILRPEGLYRVGHCNPATQLVEESSWDGKSYRIGERYQGGRLPEIEDDYFVEFRHLLTDMFNGLTESGFVIRGVWEDPRHLKGKKNAQPGTEDHLLTYVQKYFAVVAHKL